MTVSVMQVLHQGGGAGSVLSTLHLSIGLARSGFHVRFVCPPNSEVEAEARKAGLDVVPAALAAGDRRGNARILAGLLKPGRVDVVNSQSARDRAALTWMALTGSLRVPLVVTRRQMPRTFWVENWLVGRAATRVVAVSSRVADALVRRGISRRKLVVIPNGLIRERVDVIPSSEALEHWKTRIGWESSRRTIGIVARWKDQAVVLRALQHLDTPVRLVLAGVEPERIASLLGRVPARHAVVPVEFTSDIRALYELLEVVLLPSRMEGLSQSLLEAMALTKPVVASRAAGNLDLVTDGIDGRLVEPLDPGAWAMALQQILSNPSLARQLGTAASETARKRYSLEQTIQRTGDLYRSLTGRH